MPESTSLHPDCPAAGVDEAGRGALAGPVMAAAVVLHPDRPIAGITDSKKLSPGQREQLAGRIQMEALAWFVASADVEEIDRLNILQASLLAMKRALCGLAQKPAHADIDGPHLPTGLPCSASAIIAGDALVPAISAASILAKVARDAHLRQLDSRWPGYGFAAHKGYGTCAHRKALAKLGPSPCHRRSFAPVRALLAHRT